jgi:hypothetical protein
LPDRSPQRQQGKSDDALSRASAVDQTVMLTCFLVAHSPRAYNSQRSVKKMNNNTTQELLPPLRGPERLSAWFDWLTDPLPRRFMLPATGLLIMGLDWLLFSQEAASFGLLIPFTSLTGFSLGSLGTYLLQTRYARDRKPAALLKGLLAGVLVGIPFPLAGTFAGAWILTMSGLAGLKWRLLKNRSKRH